MPRRFKLVRRIRKLKQRFEPDASWARIRYGIRAFVRYDRRFVIAEIVITLALALALWWACSVFGGPTGIIAGVVSAAIVQALFLRHNVGRVRHYMDRAVRVPLPRRRQ